MRETPEKVKEMEVKRAEEENVGNNLETKTEMAREPSEAEDESAEKIQNVNDLTECIKTMNIHQDSDDDASFIVRGPDGGKPTMMQYATRGPYGGKATGHEYVTTSTADKVFPMQMPKNFGAGQNYMAYHAQTQKPGRRMPDEPSDQPYKYTRPQAEMVPQPFVPVHPQAQMGMKMGFCNNLSQPPDTRLQNTFGNQSQVFNFGADQSAATTTTQMRFTSSTSGGIVKVQSPVNNMQSPDFGNLRVTMADEFLDTLNVLDHDTTFASNQLPPCSMQPSQINETYSGKAFKEARRSSDPDSGVESAEERSPYSVQTPSPASSVYTSPPSVDSGCGLSPNYEPFPADKGCVLNGMSSPKYPGMQSPASYRTTPSPAGTSGYGSPLAPQNDEEIFDEKRYSDLGDVLDVIGHDLTSCQNTDKNLRKSIESQQKEISQMVQHKQPVPVMPMNDFNMVNRAPNVQAPAQQNFVPMPPQQVANGVPPKAGPAQPGVPVAQAIPAVSGQQPNFIIIPPSSTQPIQPIYVFPVSTPQQQKKPDKKLRKILPKISKAPTSNSNTASTANSSGALTSTCPSKTAGVTMVTKVTPATEGKGPAQPQKPTVAPKTDRLLLIARRTVASIPRDALQKVDADGDTYLHIAVCRTDKQMVQALLERLHREGLESLVDQENNKRQTPLYLAVYINQPVMVNMFIQFRANVNVLAQNLSADGQTTEVKAAIHVAAAHGDDYLKTLCELLRAKDLSINIVNNYGQTALHCAILAHKKPKRNSPERINSIEIIKTLLKHNADPTAQDKKSGKTPLMYAIEQRNLELVETILSQVEPEKVKNVVKTQAFDGSSCLKIAEGLKDSYNVQIWNRLWNSLQSAASGSLQQLPVQQVY